MVHHTHLWKLCESKNELQVRRKSWHLIWETCTRTDIKQDGKQRSFWERIFICKHLGILNIFIKCLSLASTSSSVRTNKRLQNFFFLPVRNPLSSCVSKNLIISFIPHLHHMSPEIQGHPGYPSSLDSNPHLALQSVRHSLSASFWLSL